MQLYVRKKIVLLVVFLVLSFVSRSTFCDVGLKVPMVPDASTNSAASTDSGLSKASKDGLVQRMVAGAWKGAVTGAWMQGALGVCTGVIVVVNGGRRLGIGTEAVNVGLAGLEGAAAGFWQGAQWGAVIGLCKSNVSEAQKSTERFLVVSRAGQLAGVGVSELIMPKATFVLSNLPPDSLASLRALTSEEIRLHDGLPPELVRAPSALSKTNRNEVKKKKKKKNAAQQVPNMEAERNPATAHMFIINPLTGQGMDNLFATHPSTENRIAALRQLAAEIGAAGGAAVGASSYPLAWTVEPQFRAARAVGVRQLRALPGDRA